MANSELNFDFTNTWPKKKKSPEKIKKSITPKINDGSGAVRYLYDGKGEELHQKLIAKTEAVLKLIKSRENFTIGEHTDKFPYTSIGLQFLECIRLVDLLAGDFKHEAGNRSKKS